MIVFLFLPRSVETCGAFSEVHFPFCAARGAFGCNRRTFYYLVSIAVGQLGAMRSSVWTLWDGVRLKTTLDFKTKFEDKT